MRISQAAALVAALALSACTSVAPAALWTGAHAGWTAAAAGVRPVGLGVPGGAALAQGGGVRLYILSDDNGSERQRTLLLAFDVGAGKGLGIRD